MFAVCGHAFLFLWGYQRERIPIASAKYDEVLRGDRSRKSFGDLG